MERIKRFARTHKTELIATTSFIVGAALARKHYVDHTFKFAAWVNVELKDMVQDGRMAQAVEAKMYPRFTPYM